MQKIRYIQTHATGSDETAPYDIVFNGDCTLRELINHILTRYEVGTITVKGHWVVKFNGIYTFPKISEDCELLNKFIEDAYCLGGWGQMEYFIKLK